VPRAGSPPELELYPVQVKLLRYQLSGQRQPNANNTFAGMVGSIGGMMSSKYTVVTVIICIIVIIIVIIISTVVFSGKLNYFYCDKQIQLIAERLILKIHQNSTNYCYIVDVLVSIRNLHQRKICKNVRIIGCVSMNF